MASAVPQEPAPMTVIGSTRRVGTGQVLLANEPGQLTRPGCDVSDACANKASKLTRGRRKFGKPPLTIKSEITSRAYGNRTLGQKLPMRRFKSSVDAPAIENTPACF